MAELMQVNRQLATRPDDQKFVGLAPLAAMLSALRAVSAAAVYGTDQIKLALTGAGAIALQGPKGHHAIPTNWAWKQISALAGAPADYMGDLAERRPDLVVDALNDGLAHRTVDKIQLLVRKPGDVLELHAATGPKYGRINNDDVIRALMDHVGDGLTGTWRVPGEFGKPVPITIKNTTIFGSDRDIFVFLCDEEHRIEIPNRRGGKPGGMARGFFVRNSEVGAGVFEIWTFLFDYVCCNRIIWGVEMVTKIRFKHTSGALDRWQHDVIPALREYANRKASDVTTPIKAAQARKLELPPADFLRRFDFTGPVIKKIEAAHMTVENRPIETLWDAATGVTEYAKSIPWQDARVKVEAVGGKILDLAL